MAETGKQSKIVNNNIAVEYRYTKTARTVYLQTKQKRKKKLEISPAYKLSYEH